VAFMAREMSESPSPGSDRDKYLEHEVLSLSPHQISTPNMLPESIALGSTVIPGNTSRSFHWEGL
jgi:hypothetical protein